jgi:glycosyltransferase involved in cell wall biosynthesis
MVVGRWWVLPDASRARRFVPLDQPGPLVWYLDNLLIASSSAQRVARACLRRLPRSAGWIARTHVTALVRGAPCEVELASAPSMTAAGISPHARLLVMSSGYDAGSRAVVLPFGPGAARPEAAVKVSVLPAINSTTWREHEHLTTLRTSISRDLAGTMPVPIAAFDWRGHAVAVQSLLDGPTLERVLRESRDAARPIALLHEVTDWVIRLHRETAVHTIWNANAVERWLSVPFAQFRDVFDPSDDIDRLLTAVERRARELEGRPLPTVRRHVDLGPWNVIRTSRGLGVTDWESAPNRPSTGRGLPVCDLDYFLKYWLHIVDEQTAPALFPCLGPVPDGGARPLYLAARRMMRRYCTRVGIDTEFVPVLSAFNWVEHALNRVARDAFIDRPRAGEQHLLALIHQLARHADTIGDDAFDVLGPPRPRRRLLIAAPFGVGGTPSHGGARVIGDMTTTLATRHDVRLLATVARRTSGSALPVASAGAAAQEVERPSPQPWRRARLLTSALAGRPAWAVDWASPAFEQALASAVATWRPDALHIEYVVLADALSELGEAPPIVVTDHDPPFAAAIDQFRRDGWPMRVYRAMDAQAWLRMERRAARRATVMCVFTHDDRQLLERLRLAAPVVVMPFAMNVPPHTVGAPASRSSTLAFIGSHRHPPNTDAMRFLVEQLMPRLWRDRPDIELRVIGSDPPRFVLDGDARVSATGFVPDLSAVLEDVALVVAPLASGGGMRVKVLEAMAHGKAVVATPLAVRGLPLDALAAVSVAEGLEPYADAVLRLLTDHRRREQLGQRARSWAEAWMAPDAVADRLDDLYDLVDALSEVRR